MKLRPEEETNNFTLLRLALAMMVVFGHFKLLFGTPYHPFPFNMADVAVDAFFVVSGYLIAGSYERTRGLWSFYVRRVFRLYPMYACIVVAQTGIMLALLPGGPLSEPNATLRYLGTNLLFANFLQYTAEVNSFMPAVTIPFLAWSATIAEFSLGVLLVVGIWPRAVAIASAVLLLLFGTAMAISFGVKSPLDYSVFSASACALLLAAYQNHTQEKQ